MEVDDAQNQLRETKETGIEREQRVVGVDCYKGEVLSGCSALLLSAGQGWLLAPSLTSPLLLPKVPGSIRLPCPCPVLQLRASKSKPSQAKPKRDLRAADRHLSEPQAKPQ